MWNPFRKPPPLPGPDAWKRELRQILVTQVFEPGTPWYTGAFSFLQPDPVDWHDLVGLDLFLPEYPLAIDFLGPDLHATWDPALVVGTREAWEARKSRLDYKQRLLVRYPCAYVQLRWDEPRDPASLSARIRSVTSF